MQRLHHNLYKAIDAGEDIDLKDIFAYPAWCGFVIAHGIILHDRHQYNSSCIDSWKYCNFETLNANFIGG